MLKTVSSFLHQTHRVLYLKFDIDPWLITPLFYLFADVTQSHARCSFTSAQSLKRKIFVNF